MGEAEVVFRGLGRRHTEDGGDQGDGEFHRGAIPKEAWTASG
jgi:hypothetical protein